jgi:cytoskeletal protein CcmA (bactofilin family)
MWNKRPDAEISKSYDPPAAAGASAPAMPSAMDTPAVKTDFESSRHGAAVIGKAVKIVGEIYTSEDLLIEGFVQGTVEALNQNLTVGPNGTLHANVQVRQMDVQGNVQGNVDACERVDIRKGARLVGNIRAARINLEDGAYFKGSVDIVTPEPAVAQASRPVSGFRAAPASPSPVTNAEFELALSSSR